jgi:hypothetical protein
VLNIQLVRGLKFTEEKKGWFMGYPEELVDHWKNLTVCEIVSQVE